MELSMMQRAVDKCAKILSDKGYQVHGIEFDVVANREPRGYFSLSENGKSFSEFLNFTSTAYDLEMIDFVEGLPTPAEKQKQRIHEQLLELIDAARQADMPVDFLNPLTAMAERLASNALEAPKRDFVASDEISS